MRYHIFPLSFFIEKPREFICIYRIVRYFIEIPGAFFTAGPRARKSGPERREKDCRPNGAGRSSLVRGLPPLSLFRVPRFHENVSSSLLAGDSAAPRCGATTANARKCGVNSGQGARNSSGRGGVFNNSPLPGSGIPRGMPDEKVLISCSGGWNQPEREP